MPNKHENIDIDKLLKDKKSGFSKFVRKNNGLKTLQRDFIDGDLMDLYIFYINKTDPNWNLRMKRTKDEH